jgi:hypothetical protein
MKKYEVLTDESILQLKRAIGCLEVYSEQFPSPITAEVIENLKAIIKNVQDE